MFLGLEEIGCSPGEVTNLVPIPYITTEERNYSGREKVATVCEENVKSLEHNSAGHSCEEVTAWLNKVSQVQRGVTPPGLSTLLCHGVAERVWQSLGAVGIVEIQVARGVMCDRHPPMTAHMEQEVCRNPSVTKCLRKSMFRGPG